ncbi:GntR family transcriptional regulator [Halobacillus fulvus]|nr:GntR family transcriptional regulator [Halobacillus fulvus]
MITIKQTLNVKVFEDLYNKIKSNYYALGEKLPTESEMQEIYGVSRAPIRQALGRLQTEGLIERRPGIGSVVIENDLSGPSIQMGGFSSNFNRRWSQLNCRTVDVSKVVAEEDVAKGLELKPDSLATKITRLRSDQDTPTFLLFHYYVDADVQTVKNAGEILHMRQFASEVLGLEFAFVNEEIRAVKADDQLSYYLEVEKGYPILQINRTSYNSEYKPVEYVRYFVRTEDWPYKVMYNQDGGKMEL